MAAKLKQSLGAYGIIAGLSALLVVLGVLQFRWSNQIRTAELQRKQAALEAGDERVSRGFPSRAGRNLHELHLPPAGSGCRD